MPFCLLSAVAVIAAVAAEPAPLVDLPATFPVIDAGNVGLTIRLTGAVPGGKDLEFTCNRADGAWTAVAGKAAGFEVTAAGDGLVWDGTHLTGKIASTLTGKGKDPAAPVTVTATVTAKAQPLVPADPAPAEPGRRFWLDQATSQGAKWMIEGTWTVDGGGTGAIAGIAAPPDRLGHWDMGTGDGAGLRFDFDLGKSRQNWNYARTAVLPLLKPADLRVGAGLRVTVTTAKPRPDAEVSVWLRENDGSWWYWKSAAPLVATSNTVDLPFRALAEAEWVAPGSHLDEDYVFDRSAVSHIAVGVVNPFGIGPVSFAVTAVAVLPGPEPALPAGQVTVSGKPLEVNGYSVIPSGIFGGFAYSLPQEHRPGSQRRLYPSNYPWIPRQAAALIAAHDLGYVDPPENLPKGAPVPPQTPAAIAAVLAKPDGPRAPAVKQVIARTEALVAAAAEAAKGGKPSKPFASLVGVTDHRKLADILNGLVKDPGLWDAKAFAGIAIPPAVKTVLEKTEGRTDTALMEANRILLDTLFAGELKPMRPATEAFFVDCFGERKEPAIYLRSDKWQKDLADFGQTYATHAKREGSRTILEFWNEPYLNWAERSRVNLSNNFYRVDLAGEGQPVRVKRADGSTKDEDIVPHLAWQKDKAGWKVMDTTAFSYWSGKGNGAIYDRMFAVMAESLKTAWPDQPVSAGWGFRWNEDHWAAWDLLYKPTIDNGWKWMDFVHEHHYQGDTRAMMGTYEVLTAYGMMAHKKWLRAINTETNDLVDAPARGRVDSPEKVEAATNYRRMCYNLRDLIQAAAEVPDKFHARAMIHHQKAVAATECTFGLVRHLRGRLVAAETGDPDLWCAASIDGTDPLAPETDGRLPPPALVAVVWNDAREPREVTIDLKAPPGMTFAGPAQTIRTTVNRATFAIALERRDAPASGTSAKLTTKLDERAGFAIRIPLDGILNDGPVITRRQFLADAVLRPVTTDQPVDLTVAIDAQQLAAANRAWLRLVVEDLRPNQGVITVNGSTAVPLPATWDADNGTTIVKIPVDLKALTASTKLRATSAAGFATWRLDMASVVLETGK